MNVEFVSKQLHRKPHGIVKRLKAHLNRRSIMLLRCETSSSFLRVFSVVSLVLLWSVVMGVLSSDGERDHTQSDVVICNWLPARRTLLAAIPLYQFALISLFSPEVSAGQQMCVRTIGGHCGSDQPWSLYRQGRHFETSETNLCSWKSSFVG